ncbi:MAG: nucleotidyltransferase family protein [bacterium]|nr:nucleotidyltransferase family protein [bacterium]
MGQKGVEEHMSYEAIITAAGMSRRMGQPKQLLPLGEGTVLEHTIRNFLQAGVKDVTVITGFRREEIEESIRHLHVQCIYNPYYERNDMLASVCMGIAEMKRDTKGALISPADVPFISPSLIKQVIFEMEETSCDMVVPCVNGEMGRPPLLSRKMLEELSKWKKQGGLHRFLEENKEKIRQVSTDESWILQDMDTPEAYHQILKIEKIWKKKIL